VDQEGLVVPEALVVLVEAVDAAVVVEVDLQVAEVAGEAGVGAAEDSAAAVEGAARVQEIRILLATPGAADAVSTLVMSPWFSTTLHWTRNHSR
jgi:hypothetical protein